MEERMNEFFTRYNGASTKETLKYELSVRRNGAIRRTDLEFDYWNRQENMFRC